MYTEPETVYEYTNVTKKLIQLQAGDKLANGTHIGDVVIGHKYVTVKGTNGQQLWRELLETARDAEVEVTVRRQTEESRDSQQRYDGNQAILRELERTDSSLAQAKASFAERWTEWGQLNYSTVGSILEAEADFVLWTRFEANIKFHLEQGLDHVGALELYVDSMKDTLLSTYRQRGISRSTNRISNLIEDIENERMAKFIDAARWFGVK